MKIKLQKVEKNELKEVHSLQVASFQSLLDKYQDIETNPAAEPLAKIEYRFAQTFTTYFFIKLEEKKSVQFVLFSRQKIPELELAQCLYILIFRINI